MSDESNELKDQLNKFKPKKKKITVPKEFLDNAKSYEDKLILIKTISEKEKPRVVQIFKDLLKK
jgi:hypothetical protein